MAGGLGGGRTVGRAWNMGLWTILHGSVLNPSYR